MAPMWVSTVFHIVHTACPLLAIAVGAQAIALNAREVLGFVASEAIPDADALIPSTPITLPTTEPTPPIISDNWWS